MTFYFSIGYASGFNLHERRDLAHYPGALQSIWSKLQPTRSSYSKTRYYFNCPSRLNINLTLRWLALMQHLLRTEEVTTPPHRVCSYSPRGWPSSWSKSKQFENCLHFFNLLSANYNNLWSTYQYYEVWRQSNHEVWRTLSKLLHQFLNLDIDNSQSRRACISRCHPMTKSYEICTFYVGSHKKTNYIHLNQN